MHQLYLFKYQLYMPLLIIASDSCAHCFVHGEVLSMYECDGINCVYAYICVSYTQIPVIQAYQYINTSAHTYAHLHNMCGVCHRFQGKQFSSPVSPSLPAFRVQESPPFSYTGVDFAGPLFVKSGKGKAWIFLFKQSGALGGSTESNCRSLH